MSEETGVYDDEMGSDQVMADEVRKDAFEVGGVRWRELPLLPFSIARKSYFLAWRTAMGAPPMGLLFAADALGFLGDALRLIFLCSRTPEELERLRYDLRVMQAACDAWADEVIRPGEELEVVGVGLRLWNGTTVTQHAVQVDPDVATSLGKSRSRVKKRSM
jgi:hypothetical protein